jgi:hypothetical protein
VKVDKNVEYFSSPMAKFANTKDRYLYNNQPQFTSNPLDTFVFLISEIDCLNEYFDVILCPLDASTL